MRVRAQDGSARRARPGGRRGTTQRTRHIALLAGSGWRRWGALPWRPRVGCAARGGGGGHPGRGGRRLAGSGLGPRRPTAPVHCALHCASGAEAGREGGREERALPTGGGAGPGRSRRGGSRGAPWGGPGGLAAAPGAAGRAAGVEDGPGPAHRETDSRRARPRRLTSGASPAPRAGASRAAADSAPWRLERGSRSNAAETAGGGVARGAGQSARGVAGPGPLGASNVVSNTWGGGGELTSAPEYYGLSRCLLLFCSWLDAAAAAAASQHGALCGGGAGVRGRGPAQAAHPESRCPPGAVGARPGPALPPRPGFPPPPTPGCSPASLPFPCLAFPSPRSQQRPRRPWLGAPVLAFPSTCSDAQIACVGGGVGWKGGRCMHFMPAGGGIWCCRRAPAFCTHSFGACNFFCMYSLCPP